MEKELDFLERQEAMVSTNESLILTRLKAMEKSPEELIQEARYSWTVLPEPTGSHLSGFPSPSANNLNTPANTLFGVEINVTENMLTGSRGNVSAEERCLQSGLQVCDEDSRCPLQVLVLTHRVQSVSQQPVLDSGVQRCFTELSARSQPEKQNYLSGFCRCHHQDGKKTKGGHHGNYIHQGTTDGKNVNFRQTWQKRPHDEHSYSPSSTAYWGLCPHDDDQRDSHSRLCEMRSCGCIFKDGPAIPHRSRRDGTVCRTELCHNTAGFLPSVDKSKFYCYYTSSIRPESGCNRWTALYSDPAHCSRLPSPLCAEDQPYTILHSAESSEPITAIFMGFHTAQDDSGQLQECEGTLKAELVKIEDHSEEGKKVNQVSERCPSKRNQGGRWSEKKVEPGVRNLKEKQKLCCTVA
ncbi:uncharacterized protein LOC119792232 isoform X1 [Cyprinodon tularosa]|uniref:uncharacterized protein LOC119792232 isoform X1 n=1 Tax=Cyprinodon tularosa TaxID=77115 RepID=UPI0018E24123|nr:uncharacterized protein LOC119792232 isoform X1 [Cyprinodon tularosa]